MAAYDSLYQSYVNLRLHLDEFAPQQAVLFAFLNDFDDLETHRSVEQLEHRPEIAELDYDALRARIEEQGRHPPGRLARLYQGSAARRFLPAAWGVLVEELGGLAAGPAHADESRFGEPLLDEVRFARLSAYYDALLGDLARRTRATGTELTLVHLDLGPLDWASARARTTALLESATRAHGIAYYDTGPRLLRCTDCQLENDGHLSPTGHAILADFIARSMIGDSREARQSGHLR